MSLFVKTDGFLTHSWAIDTQGRDNHERVSKINAALKLKGYVPWFDEERMGGTRIVSTMCEGIDNAVCVVCFVTAAYIDKVGGKNGPDDNCLREFDYAIQHKTSDRIITVVMEPELFSQNWPGPVGMSLKGRLQIGFTDDSQLDEAVNKISDEIERLKGLPPPPRHVANSTASPIVSPTSAASAAARGVGGKATTEDIDPDDAKRISDLTSFMGALDITSKNVKMYAQSLVTQHGMSSVKKLQKAVAKKESVLTESFGVSDVDAEEILEAFGIGVTEKSSSSSSSISLAQAEERIAAAETAEKEANKRAITAESSRAQMEVAKNVALDRATAAEKAGSSDLERRAAEEYRQFSQVALIGPYVPLHGLYNIHIHASKGVRFMKETGIHSFRLETENSRWQVEKDDPELSNKSGHLWWTTVNKFSPISTSFFGSQNKTLIFRDQKWVTEDSEKDKYYCVPTNDIVIANSPLECMNGIYKFSQVDDYNFHMYIHKGAPSRVIRYKWDVKRWVCQPKEATTTNWGELTSSQVVPVNSGTTSKWNIFVTGTRKEYIECKSFLL